MLEMQWRSRTNKKLDRLLCRARAGVLVQNTYDSTSDTPGPMRHRDDKAKEVSEAAEHTMGRSRILWFFGHHTDQKVGSRPP